MHMQGIFKIVINREEQRDVKGVKISTLISDW